MEKVVLGFSGGLDTTFCVKYLTEDKGLEVHSVIVNTGGFSEEELKKHYIEYGMNEKRIYKLPYDFNPNIYKRYNIVKIQFYNITG
jgi:argininosuccinate synthase